MKTYLNRSEKNQVLTLTGFMDYVTNTANEWAKIGRNKDSVKFLRMAKSFIFRSLCMKCEKLDDLEQDNLKTESKKMNVVLKYKDDAVREYKQMLELDSVTPVQTSDLLDLCEKALEACKDCSEIASTCKVRTLFVKYDIPVNPDSVGVEKCPYYFKED